MNVLDQFSISPQFCGPPESGNGGYVCGRLAQYIDGPAVVRLMVPPPLNTPLQVVKEEEEIRLMEGDTVVGRAWKGAPDIEVPPAPDPATARQSKNRFAGHHHHAFPGCFVCGTERREGDGLLVYAGPDQADGYENHVACNWTPHPNFCDESGNLAEPFCWAALDCPSGWSFLSSGEDVALLGEYSVEISARLQCGEEYILAGWEYERSGRKRLTGSAIYNTDGVPLAWARATWITINPPTG